ncbi:alkaline phosphatase family protein [Geothrix fermentans]|uniref:alkaline phosphatase family protein n=1 Tax=Geothrix fermentans TaxID=44676 RepID=UPI0004064E92|nr:nucleotide pyrophosphatase/phosphodiesterase family protein [Geothrix fermentans]
MRLHALLALAFILLPLRAEAPGPAAGPVLIISEDGLGADQFRPDTMPNLWAMARQGRRAAVLPPFPATTFNGHVTLATGCWPEHHGVVANGYLRPEDKLRVPAANRVEDILREPLWVAATRSGVRTAVFHWVGASGPWEGVAPWRMQAFRPGIPDAEGLAFSERALAEGAQLVMAYLSGSDEEGHLKGPRSPETLAKLRTLDAELAPWLTRMQAAHPGLRIILTADHGMVPMKRRVHLPSVLDGIPVDLITHGGSAYVYLKQPGDRARVLARLHRAGLKAWAREQVPSRYHLGGSPRVGDVVVLAPLGTWLSQARSSREDESERHGRAGAHAYTPESAPMKSWLVVLGAGQGPLADVPAWDIAPTAAAWLGIRWAQAPDGKPVAALLPR